MESLVQELVRQIISDDKVSNIMDQEFKFLKTKVEVSKEKISTVTKAVEREKRQQAVIKGHDIDQDEGKNDEYYNQQNYEYHQNNDQYDYTTNYYVINNEYPNSYNYYTTNINRQIVYNQPTSTYYSYDNNIQSSMNNPYQSYYTTSYQTSEGDYNNQYAQNNTSYQYNNNTYYNVPREEYGYNQTNHYDHTNAYAYPQNQYMDGNNNFQAYEESQRKQYDYSYLQQNYVDQGQQSKEICDNKQISTQDVYKTN